MADYGDSSLCFMDIIGDGETFPIPGREIPVCVVDFRYLLLEI